MLNFTRFLIYNDVFTRINAIIKNQSISVIENKNKCGTSKVDLFKQMKLTATVMRFVQTRVSNTFRGIDFQYVEKVRQEYYQVLFH